MKSRQILLPAVLPASTLVAAELCGTAGISSTLPYYTSTSPALYNAVACAKHCVQDTECHAYALGLGMCLHFASPSSSIFQEMESSPWTLFDRGCPPAAEAHRSQLVPASAPCLIDPRSTEGQFRLLGPDFVPLVKTVGNQLRPRRAAAYGREEKVPNFFFKEGAAAPAGLYDLVLAGPETQYVAKTANGEMIFTSASTGSSAQNVDGKQIVTSIFTVDCDGRIGVMHEGVHFGWNVSSNGRTTSLTAEAGLSNSTLVAFDVEKFGASPNHHELRRSLAKRNDFLAKRAADLRCPAGQRAIGKPGVAPNTPNGCGSGFTAKLTPEFSFGACCRGHDTCFNDCGEQSCSSCNNAFYSCMKSTCDGKNFFKKNFCRVAAKTYYEAVENLGCSIFQNKTRDRCQCTQG